MRDEAVGKGINLIVGVLAALMIAGVVFFIANKVTSTSDKAASKIDEFSNALDMESILRYDGQDDVTGSSVISYLTENKNEEICITVKTKKNAGGQHYNYNDTSRQNPLTSDENAKRLANAKKKTHNEYINPAATFTCEIKYDANNSVEEVVFTQN